MNFLDYSIPGANCTNGDIRLADYIDDPVANTRSGQLQVCVNGAWGAICSDNYFGYVEMAVACRHMNFSDKGVLEVFKYDVYTRLFCRHSFVGAINCNGNSSDISGFPVLFRI